MEILELVPTRLTKQLMEILEMVVTRLAKPSQPSTRTIPRARLLPHVHDDAADTADAARVDTPDRPPQTDTSDSPSPAANTPPHEHTPHCNTATADTTAQIAARIPSTSNDGTDQLRQYQDQDQGLDPTTRIAEMTTGPRDAKSQTVKSRSRALTRLRDAFTPPHSPYLQNRNPPVSHRHRDREPHPAPWHTPPRETGITPTRG